MFVFRFLFYRRSWSLHPVGFYRKLRTSLIVERGQRAHVLKLHERCDALTRFDEAIVIEKDHLWPNGERSIYFRDPAGNSVELASSSIWNQTVETDRYRQ